MPKLKNKYPEMKKSGKYAAVYYNKKRYRLGIWGSPEAKTAYRRFLAEIDASPVSLETEQLKGKDGALIAELAASFFKHFESRLHPSHVTHFKTIIRYLVGVYGDMPVNAFSPKKLKVVRDQMVRSGKLCRKQINAHTTKIIRIFSWGVEEELVNPNVVLALREVKHLPPGEFGTFA